MLIRPATFDDAQAIAHVHVASWRTAYGEILPADFLAGLSEAERADHWRQTLGNRESRGFTFVAETDLDSDSQRRIVGFASGGPERKGDSEYTGELSAIYLLAAHEGHGIGWALLAAVVARLREEGHALMKVWTLAENAARGFYEHCGGTLLGEVPIRIAGLDLVQVAYGWKQLPG